MVCVVYALPALHVLLTAKLQLKLQLGPPAFIIVMSHAHLLYPCAGEIDDTWNHVCIASAMAAWLVTAQCSEIADRPAFYYHLPPYVCR